MIISTHILIVTTVTVNSNLIDQGTIRERLCYLETLLFWEGQIRRSDIVSRFGVSANQVTVDIRLYEKEYPGGLRYDHRKKVYLPQENFRPKIAPLDSGDYLNLLRVESRTFLGFVPMPPHLNESDLACVQLPEHGLSEAVLRLVLLAIRKRGALTVTYQSLSSPNPKSRKLWPTALAHNGFRWHIRAFDESIREFRDFVLMRILTIEATESKPTTLPRDEAWETIIEVGIEPHPEATEMQAAVIAREYGMTMTKKKWGLFVPMRGAIAPYFEKFYALDSTARSVSAKPIQLTAKSALAIERYRFKSK